MVDLKQLYDAVLSGDAKIAAAVTQQAIAEKMNAGTLITDAMIPAMAEVGRLYECEEYFVPELLLSARAMKSALDLLRPLLAETGVKPTGKVVIGTVKGDLHDIGKNLVASMLEGGGFEVTDLGVDVSPERFINAVREKAAHIVCLSALLTVTVPSMKSTIEALKQAGIRDQVKVLVGGAPMTADYAREIGADAYGENASVAVSVARRICAAA